MLSSPWFYLSLVGVAIIIGLSIYAGRLLSQVKQQQRAQAEAERDKQQALKKHDSKVLKSVTIIVKAMQEQQCDLSEGCWRLSVLLESLKLSSDLSSQFPAVFELYSRIQALDILDARKALKKKDRMKQDLVRMKAESELSDKIDADLILLAQYSQERLSALSEPS